MALLELVERLLKLTLLFGEFGQSVVWSNLGLVLESSLLFQKLLYEVASGFGLIAKFGHFTKLFGGVRDGRGWFVFFRLFEGFGIIGNCFLEGFSSGDELSKAIPFLVLGLLHNVCLEVRRGIVEGGFSFGEVVQGFTDGLILHFGCHAGVEVTGGLPKVILCLG